MGGDTSQTRRPGDGSRAVSVSLALGERSRLTLGVHPGRSEAFLGDPCSIPGQNAQCLCNSFFWGCRVRGPRSVLRAVLREIRLFWEAQTSSSFFLLFAVVNPLLFIFSLSSCP